LLLVVLATVISATVHKVTVGSDDDNTFSPSVLNVKVNDKIIFKLVSGLHGVFLSDKPNSCVKSAKIKHP
ncbi:29141_t:CDS:2, partial [Racocetra persica]